MKKITLAVFIVMFALAFVFIWQSIDFSGISANAQSINFEEKLNCSASLDDNFADNRVLVTLKSEVSKEFNSYSKEDFSEISCVSVADMTQETAKIAKQQQFERTASNFGASDFKTVLSLELKEKSKENVIKTIKELEKRDDVLYAEPDYIMTFFAMPDPIPTNFSSQWSLHSSKPSIQIQNAWDMTKGKSSVKVAIMDSGINVFHNDLTGKIDTSLSRDFTLPSPYIPSSVVDLENHGTLVAGIVAARGTGIIGVAPDVTLVSLRVANPDKNQSGDSLNKEAFFQLQYWHLIIALAKISM